MYSTGRTGKEKVDGVYQYSKCPKIASPKYRFTHIQNVKESGFQTPKQQKTRKVQTGFKIALKTGL